MIAKLHAELLLVADDLHVAADRGLYNLTKMPYRGAQWDLRAFQRDPYVMAFMQSMPASFGSFQRRDDLMVQRRLVFHSDKLNLDLVLRRRGSFGAFRKVAPAEPVVQPELPYEPMKPVAIAADELRLAALIWDTPTLDSKHKATSPMPLAVRLAQRGFVLDDNNWESGFLMQYGIGEELIPDKTEYLPDMPDWDVDAETDAQ
ncbi:hypothetical protein [Mycobacterium timonense]|jgi:hypothetical protein|uniref:Uncharacterized protein n=1 Tax=Mycobacterium timonense TaxID=701043 RepID=A0A7I9ZAW8_9MYCO|nr:hypothetical protein [Mycobacterium timonense]GFG98141.1 hypothetical protein MTIM_40200 [Mycobacterium timonense]